MKFRGQEMSNSTQYLPAGIFECMIFLGEEKRFLGINKETGKKDKEYHKVSIGFKDAVDRVVFEDYFLNPEYLWVLEKLYITAGVQKEDVDLEDLAGQMVMVTVKKESYKKSDGSLGEKSVVAKIEPVRKDGITTVTEWGKDETWKPEDEEKESPEKGKPDPF